jgi:hypothetical protein
MRASCCFCREFSDTKLEAGEAELSCTTTSAEAVCSVGIVGASRGEKICPGGVTNVALSSRCVCSGSRLGVASRNDEVGVGGGVAVTSLGKAVCVREVTVASGFLTV